MPGVIDPSASREDEDGPVRIGRGRFLGAGLAVAGAALIPSARAATARSRPVAGAAAGAIPQLPLRATFPHLPAIPLDEAGIADTLAKLLIRASQTTQAKQGLTHKFTINGERRTAYEFLFGGSTAAAQSDAMQALAKSLQRHPERAKREVLRGLHRRSDAAPAASSPLSLERPEQFSISWTYFPNVYESGLPSLRAWASWLTDADSATRQFWPMIAQHGFGYNLIIPERVGRARATALRQEFGRGWTAKVRAALAAGNLYVIDMSRFEALQPQTVNGAPRFTPSTITLLTRNPRTKVLTPVAILVSGYQGKGRRLYTRATATEGAWLYALQAAKASITLFGVWLGHVYHWHLVTAAMQMAMLNTMPTSHPIYQLLAPQSNYVMPFDDVLLTFWSAIAPPTSLATANQFLALANDYATGRAYFDDDPTTTIKQLGLRQRDFTVKTPWDKYPVVQRLLTLWDLVTRYVETFVGATYASDAAVAADADLQTWIATSGSSDPTTGGNIQGLPTMDGRAALAKTLTSLLYRLTAHGISRLNSTSNPALTFVSNFPHCLQRTDIPSPRARIGTKALLGYLPNTDSISQAVTFYFTFAYSVPYVPFIPLSGASSNLFFSGGTGDPRNRALIDLRNGLAAFIDDYQPDMPQRYQWPLNIET
jgi:hypothetical protein